MMKTLRFHSPLPQRLSKILHLVTLCLLLILSAEPSVLAQNDTVPPNPDTPNHSTEMEVTPVFEENLVTLYLPLIAQAGNSTNDVTATSLEIGDATNRLGEIDLESGPDEEVAAELGCLATDSCSAQLYLPMIADGREEVAESNSLAPRAGTQPPVVNAGVDQIITLADPVLLRPTVTDDGLPAGLADLTATWSEVSGPGQATFDNSKEMLAVARFSAVGTYTLRLTVRDGSLSGQDDINIVVNATHIATLRVPQEYATIQAALNAAPARALVLVSPGTYNQSLTISKTLTLASTFYTTGDAARIEQTIIQGTSSSIDAIAVTSAAGLETQLIGFRVVGGEDGIDSKGHIKILNNHFVGPATDGINYASNKAGLAEWNILENGLDDGVDLNNSEVIIQKNIIRGNRGDGIEMRIKNHPTTVWNVIFRENEISTSNSDGIQIIDDDSTVATASRIVIERNLIANNRQAGIGLMDNAVTSEDYRAASLRERMILVNNTIVGSNHGLSGGDNLTAANNLFANHSNTALKGVDGSSKLFYSIFWNNGTNNNGSILDTATAFFANPLLDSTFHLMAGSPAIDAGTASLTLPNGEGIVNIPPGGFQGAAPDLGRYEGSGPPPPPVVNARITVGSDDAEQRPTGGVDLGSSDLELVFDGGIQTVGLRFTGMTIPKNAIIDTAYVQFKTDEAQSEATSLAIQGQAADQAATFAAVNANISSRPRTSASVTWTPPAWAVIGEIGANQRTPNLAPIIQEIVNRPGWVSGNALSLIITGTGHRTAEAVEGDAAGAPLLHVEYRVN